jgi:hypothetical protein
MIYDFAETGDMVCIEIPSDTLGDKQRLWLEHHKGTTIFDNRQWDTINSSVGLIIPQSHYGLYAYIDDITGSRGTTNFTTNAFKYLHSKGNYDYTLIDSTIDPNFGSWWSGKIFNFHEGAANPYSGQNRWQRIKYPNGNIYPPTIEKDMVRRDGNVTYDFAGINANFETAKKLGISSNPPLVNYPTFVWGSGINSDLAPLILNGIEVEVMSSIPNYTRVKVRRNKVDINSNYRMSARKIELMNITNWGGADTIPDLVVKSGNILTINRSGSVTRYYKRGNRFNDPTTFTCHTNSRFYVEPNSRVHLQDSTILDLRSDSKLIVDSAAVVYVECGSRIDTVTVIALNIERRGTGSNRGMIVYQNCSSGGGSGGGTGGGGGTGTTDSTRVDTIIVDKDTTDNDNDTSVVDTIVRTIIYKSTIICQNTDGSFNDKSIIIPDSTYLPDSRWFIGIDSLSDSIDVSLYSPYPYSDTINAKIEISKYLDSLANKGINTDTIQSIYIYLLLEDSTLYRWKIDISPVPTFLSEYFNGSNLPDNFVMSEGKATLNLDNGSLGQTIPLPPLDSACSYSILFDSSNFTAPDYPSILDDTLRFIFKEDFCSPASLVLHYSCEVPDCPEEFVINLHNTDCIDLCDVVEFSDTGYYEGFGSTMPQYKQLVLAKTNNGSKIISLEIIDISLLPPLERRWTPRLDTGGTDSLKCRLVAPCRGDTITKKYQICVTLDDSITQCCDTVSFTYCCNEYIIVKTIHVNDLIAIAHYELDSSITPLLPSRLEINLYDNVGDFKFNIFDANINANQLEGDIPFNTSSLAPGLYWVVFQIENEVKPALYIKQ